MSKTAILLLVAVALFAASSASGDRLLDAQNIMNSEANRAEEPLTLSIGNKKIVLSMVARPQPNCVPQGDPCGLLDHCCNPYVCYSPFPGAAIIQGSCR